MQYINMSYEAYNIGQNLHKNVDDWGDSLKTRIKELRESRGMSQEALAGLVNSSQQAICRYEKEITVPPSDIILEVANYLCHILKLILSVEL